MPFAAITYVALDTVLDLLAPYFLTAAHGDMPAAREAAAGMLADYNAETQEEMLLATEIISLRLQVLQALRDAAAPDLPMDVVIRLRSLAVSLARSAWQNQRKLDGLQSQRRAAAAKAAALEAPVEQALVAQTPAAQAPAADASIAVPAAPPAMDAARVEAVLGLVQSAAEAWTAAQVKRPGVWSREAQQQRVRARLAENKQREAEAEAPDSAAAALVAQTASAGLQAAA
jgi:hypothetical protein